MIKNRKSYETAIQYHVTYNDASLCGGFISRRVQKKWITVVKMFNIFKRKFVDESIEKQREDLKKEAPQLYPIAINGKDCDSLFNEKSGFGHSLENPIPVNGVLGEIKYLNRLRCKCGNGLLYHRLGSAKSVRVDGSVDVYETVCLEGKHWDVLYLHLYHPRRSTWLPLEYKFCKYHSLFSAFSIGFGTNRFDNSFPFGLGQYIMTHVGDGLGKALAKKYEEIVVNKDKFMKSEDHIKEISAVVLKLRGQV